MKFEDIQRVNETIATLDVKGKQYAEVNQRIKAFRMLYPEGTIETDIVSLENGVCVMRANIYIPEYVEDAKTSGVTICHNQRLLGTGTAYEKEGSTFINKTSYIENCETSAVGRALAMCGIGIDTSIASAEEVQNAIKQQEEKPNKLDIIMSYETKGVDLDAIKEAYKVTSLSKMTDEQLNDCIKKLEKKYGV